MHIPSYITMVFQLINVPCLTMTGMETPASLLASSETLELMTNKNLTKQGYAYKYAKIVLHQKFI